MTDFNPITSDNSNAETTGPDLVTTLTESCRTLNVGRHLGYMIRQRRERGEDANLSSEVRNKILYGVTHREIVDAAKKLIAAIRTAFEFSAKAGALDMQKLDAVNKLVFEHQDSAFNNYFKGLDFHILQFEWLAREMAKCDYALLKTVFSYDLVNILVFLDHIIQEGEDEDYLNYGFPQFAEEELNTPEIQEKIAELGKLELIPNLFMLQVYAYYLADGLLLTPGAEINDLKIVKICTGRM